MLRNPIVFAAAVIFGLLGLLEVSAKNWMPDLFIYRGGALLALRGESPYSIERIHALVLPQYPNEEHMTDNCGYFLPPNALTTFLPFTLPWKASQILFVLLCLVSGLVIVRWIRVVPPLVAALVLLNFPAYKSLLLGQTAMLSAGAIAAAIHVRSRPAWCGFFLALAFGKPHVALLWFPFALFLGWRHLAWLAGWLVTFTVVAMAISRQADLPLEFVRFLHSGAGLVAVNQLGTDPQMSGWTVCLWAAGGNEINATITTTLAAYAVWFTLVMLRCRGRRPTMEWAVAACAVGGLICAQVHEYEQYALVLVIPLAIAAKGWTRLGLAALLIVQAVPIEVIAPHWPPYRCWLVLATAVAVLTSPPR